MMINDEIEENIDKVVEIFKNNLDLIRFKPDFLLFQTEGENYQADSITLIWLEGKNIRLSMRKNWDDVRYFLNDEELFGDYGKKLYSKIISVVNENKICDRLTNETLKKCMF